MVTLILTEATVIFIYMTIFFVLALLLHRNDIADIIWGTIFILACVVALIFTGHLTERALLSTVLVMIWGVRLSGSIYLRNRGKSEDFRYKKWREEWGKHVLIRSYLQVFLLQGALALVIVSPALNSIWHGAIPIGPLDIVACFVWALGFFFESVGDWQKGRFKKNPESHGHIMKSGLWRYTRHPNYFGEVVQWWGIYLLAVSVPGGWITIIGPLTITLLIIKVSGIPMLEAKYLDNQEFQEYKRRTSAFFPWPPRKEGK